MPPGTLIQRKARRREPAQEYLTFEEGIVIHERRRNQVGNLIIRKKLRVKLFEMVEIKEVPAK